MISRHWKPIVALVALALLAWVVIEVVLAGREPVPPPSGTQPISLRGGKVTGNRISTRSWTFDYKHAEMSPDGISASVDGVRNGVLFKNGKPYLKISANHVQVNTQSFDFSAIGTVHIVSISSKDGVARSFDTDLVQWTNATKVLLLPHPCLIRTGDQVLKIGSASVDFGKNTLHLGNVNGSVQAPMR